jgi:group I intron endonuclease
MKHCIYQILNLINGKFYIGHSQDYDVRWWEHTRKLKVGKHDNAHLQRAWIKYGEGAFEFILIELVRENETLNREQYWINLLGACDIKLGYNINPDALRPPSGLGRKRTPEQRARISAATTGISKSTTENMKKPKSESHKRSLSFAKRASSDWPCPDGYSCGCDICRPRRNRMKNYPHIYGNPNSEYYRK